MAVSVNLMTERAQRRAAADRILRAWGRAAGAAVLSMCALAGWEWHKCRRVTLEHEALEASYDPIRRLAGANRTLGVQAAQFVTRERIALELARHRPAAALLATVADAVAATSGAVFMERLVLSRDPVAGAPPATGATASQAVPAGRLTLELTSVVSYDPSELVRHLDALPFSSAKVNSSEILDDGVVARKKHVIECQF
jgi:hypothetical protein